MLLQKYFIDFKDITNIQNCIFRLMIFWLWFHLNNAVLNKIPNSISYFVVNQRIYE